MCLIWLLQCTLLGCIVTKPHTYISQKKSTSSCSTGLFFASPSNITTLVWLICPLYFKQHLRPPLMPNFLIPSSSPYSPIHRHLLSLQTLAHNAHCMLSVSSSKDGFTNYVHYCGPYMT